MTAEREAMTLERELQAHVSGMQCAIDNCGISQKEWDAAAKYAMDNIGEWRRLLSEYAASISRAAEPVAWHEGEPPHPWNKEWFIAVTTYSDRVVLRALPEEYTYDYTTADQTYIKADKIKRWMQFPDSEFVPYTHPPEPARDAKEMVRNALLLLADQFDGMGEAAYADGEYDRRDVWENAASQAKSRAKDDSWIDAAMAQESAMANNQELAGLPAGVIDAALKLGIWARKNNLCDWRVGEVASRDECERLVRTNIALTAELAALKRRIAEAPRTVVPVEDDGSGLVGKTVALLPVGGE